jgi:hypothetical protein
MRRETVPPTPAAKAAATVAGSTRKMAAGPVSGAWSRCLSTPGGVAGRAG